MGAEVRWLDGMKVEARTRSGATLEMDGDGSPSPVEVFMLSAGACTIMDVIHGLKDRPVEHATVDLDYHRAETYLRKVTSMHLNFALTTSAPDALVRRLIEKSQSTYCSVGATLLDAGVDVTWSLDLTPLT